jgi:MoaA/NifB/PqqE/SkfB family radical SAM enzyme
MANLAISAVCNLNCPYCFTRDHLEGTVDGSGFVEIESFRAWLDFLDRSQIDQVRLLGGEPTLHPQFSELIALCRACDKSIMVFSNGLIPSRAMDCLEELSAAECTVLVNVNEPALDGERLHRQRHATIQRLGERVLVGFNIYRADCQLEFLLAMIAEAGCQRVIRLGMAQPCLSGANQYIQPNQYRFIGAKIVQFARLAANAGIILDFDCGFVRCMFSTEDLEVLTSLATGIGWRCNPILDIDITGRVIHCYPLSQLGSLPLSPETDAATLRSTFESFTRHYRQAGVFQECSTCPMKRSGTCTGGCLAATIRRFHHEPFSLIVPHDGIELSIHRAIPASHHGDGVTDS